MFGFKLPKKLTRADVVWCFENIAGRSPYSEAETDHFLESCTDFRDLVKKLVALPEEAPRAAAPEGDLGPKDLGCEDLGDLQATVLAILGRLEPMRAVEHRKIRVGRDKDGGYVMLDDFGGIAAAYSIGVSDDVSWDLDMAARGIDVFQYDHTIDAIPLAHERFHWTKKGIGTSPTAELDTLPRLLEINGHRGRSDLLLKCDIEGCEWEVLAALPPECLRHFKQIVIELHDLERLADPEFAARARRAIGVLTADHRVVHVHANNHRPYAIVGGVPLPSVLELTMARAGDVRLEKTDEMFPSALDMPCHRGRADYRLGPFRF